MALKKVKPDPRFTSKKKYESLAHARGTSVEKGKKQDVIAKDVARIKKTQAGDKATGVRVSVQQPTRDEAGMTAMDRQIAGNKEALAAREEAAISVFTGEQDFSGTAPNPQSFMPDPGTDDGNFLQRLIGMTPDEIKQVREAALSGEQTQRTGMTVSPTAGGMQWISDLARKEIARRIVADAFKDPIKFQPGINQVAQEVGKVAPNFWSKEIITKIVKSAATKKGLLVISGAVAAVAGTLQTYAWNGHLKFDNIVGNYMIRIGDAYRAGNEEVALRTMEEAEAYLDQTWYEDIIDYIPLVNVAYTTFFKGLGKAKNTFADYKKLIADAPAIAANESKYYADIDAAKREQDLADEKARNARYDERLAAAREQDKKDNKELADQIRKDAEERRKADLELAIEKNKIYNNFISNATKFDPEPYVPYDPPSALNFGLI